MAPRHPKKPEQRPDTSHDPEGPCPEKTLETTSGVKVVVRSPPPAPEPRPEPEPPWGTKQAIIVPAGQGSDAYMKAVYEEHGAFIVDTLMRRWKLQPASADDMRQDVLVVLLEHNKTKEPPANVRGFLQGVMWKEVLHRHRGRQRRPLVLNDGDADAAVSPGMDPERAAALAEHRAKIRRYIGCLPEPLAEVVQLLDLMGWSLDDAAEALDRPRGTVSTQHIRARKELRDLARASERGTKLGGHLGGG